MSEHVIVTRWDAILNSVISNFDATVAQATAASEAMIATSVTDFGPLQQAWGAVEHRLHQATDRVSDGWDETSDELSELDELPDEVMDREGTKRDAGTTELEIRYQRAYRDVMGRAATVMYQHALALDVQTQSCQQCGATLAMGPTASVQHARNVACGHCQAVNTVDPGPALRMFAGGGAHHLAEHSAFGAWERMVRLEHQIDQFRENKDVSIELLSMYERACHDYWQQRLVTEAQLVPELRPYVEGKLAGYMKSARRKLAGYWQWRSAQA